MAKKPTRSSWDGYSKRQRAQREQARDQMRRYVLGEIAAGSLDMVAVKRNALRIATRNGMASAALACEWYDAIAREAAAQVAKAAPVVVANPGRIAAQVDNAAPLIGLGDADGFADACGSAVAAEVKRSASRTMLDNAARDGAEFAWVPQGDETCAFCITLASNGWTRASRDVVDGNHADHIHPNCDCEFAIRFGGDGGPAGYDWREYADIYGNADGRSSDDKINSIRRELYAERRDEINAQHRDRYAATHQKGDE